MSSITLTQDQINILSKGLLFIPTSDKPLPGIEPDIDVFARRLRLAYLFRDSADSQHPFHTPSSFTPDHTDNRCLEKYINDMYTLLPTMADEPIPNRPSNLSPTEKRALSHLCKLRNKILINKADKGNTVVISDIDYYVTECTTHLSDTSTYKMVDQDPTRELASQVFAFCKPLRDADLLDQQTFSFIVPPAKIRTPVFYGLWKIHKQPITIRPIVSGCSGPLAGLATFLDFFLKKALTEVNAHLINTQHLIKELSKLPPLPCNTSLITIDVKSLYTSIPIDEGLDALMVYANLVPLPNTTTKRLLTLVLKNNFFVFNKAIYHQLTGVAMGSPISPTLAILFMHNLETNFLSKLTHKPLFWKRYIDDIFVLWDGDQSTINNFISLLNNTHPSISFTHTSSQISANFLDLTIYKSSSFTTSGVLSYKPFSKPTNHHLYVHSQSHHPVATKKSIIRGETIRLMRSCSDENVFQSFLIQLKLSFRDRGYTNPFINSAMQNLPDFQHRYDKTAKESNPDTTMFFFKTFFDHRRPQIKPLILANFEHLEQDPEAGKAFRGASVLICHKNIRSIKNILTRSALKGDTSVNTWDKNPATTRPYLVATVTSPCGERGCGTCGQLARVSMFTATATGERTSVTTRMNCRSRNVIYCIKCNICSKQYIGQTSLPLHIRMNKHRDRFLHTKEDPKRYLLYKHLDNHGGFSNTSITPIIAVEHASQLKSVEERCILQFKTYIPFGLNSLFSLPLESSLRPSSQF